MNQKEFEDRYYHRVVRIKGELWPDLRGMTGYVTAALLKHEKTPLIAIWTTGGEWNTFNLDPDLSELSEFEILR